MDPSAWVSARSAAEILGEVSLSRNQARRLLAAGFAGGGIRTSAAVLYERSRVTALSTWPGVAHPTVDANCPHGLFVARLGPRREVDVSAEWEELSALVRGGWDMSLWTQILIHSRAERYGALPFVATVSGFVALGADILATARDREGRVTLELARPGAWFAAFGRRRFVTGPGRDWFVWGWPPKNRE